MTARPILVEDSSLGADMFRTVGSGKRIEDALRFLAHVNTVLTESLDSDAIIQRIIHLAHPRLADVCLIHLLEEGAPGKWCGLECVEQQGLPKPEMLDSALQVWRTGQPVVFSEVPDALVPGVINHGAWLNSSSLKSGMIVPLTVHNRSIGALFLLSGPTRECYDSSDQALAEVFAGRAALAIYDSRLYEAEQKARIAAVEAQARLAYLADASHMLNASLDYEETLKRLAKFAVPNLADWCSIDMLEDDGTVRSLAIAHKDPLKVELAHHCRQRFSARPHEVQDIAEVLSAGHTYLAVEVSEALLGKVARDETELRMLRGLRLRSAMIVPFIARGRTLGTITFLSAESDRRYTVADVALAEAFAHRAALAVDNARLFREVQAGHARLQRLSCRLMEIQENERRHVARELHDEVGQMLTGLKLTLETVTRLPIKEFQQRLQNAQGMVNELMMGVRELSLDLRPGMLDDFGLVPALLWHFERYTGQTEITVAFTHAGVERRFEPELETAAYRIVQEALTNVARHARVRDVAVGLSVDDGMLVVQIEDQGAGFEPAPMLASSTSMGLSGMRERSRLLGGRLTIESKPGWGTLLYAEFPLDNARLASQE